MSGNPPILYGPDNRPLSSSGPNPFGSYEVSRTAAGFRGTLSNWLVARNTKYSARRERQAIADRAEDLAANDTHAASGIDSITINTVGTGLLPKSRSNARLLGKPEVKVGKMSHGYTDPAGTPEFF